MKSFLAVAALVCMSGAGHAQTVPAYPVKPVRIINPFSPGGSLDLVSRTLAKFLSAELGQPVIVENRPGANGMIAAREAARAAPDGHTMFLALINNAVGDILSTDTCCRLGQELTPVSRFSMTPLVMVVHPGVPARTFAEFVEQAKANPDKFTFASHGPGSVGQLAGERIKMERGIKLLDVPYKGVNSELPDLHGGQLSVAFPVPQVVLSSIRAGKLRALAVMSRERLEILPDVPSVAELGIPQAEAVAWNGIFVPAGTPASVVETLHRELVRAYKAPEIVQQLRGGGAYAAADTPAEFLAFIRAEKDKWGKVIREAGIKAQ